MCRLAAYIGPELSLREFIISPVHSLYRQSWAAKEMQDAILNADGFGFCWYQDSLPRRYRNTEAIWSDQNLPELADSLKQRLWLAYVRSATAGQGMGPDNTQPFIHNKTSFFHNGYIAEFELLKPSLIEILDTRYLSLIRGNTDSEYLFALWLQSQSSSHSMLETFQHFRATLYSLCDNTPALLSLLISDGDKIYAYKDAISATAPSLYYTHTANNDEPSVTIASEPFDDNQTWEALKPGQLLTADLAQPCQLQMIS